MLIAGDEIIRPGFDRTLEEHIVAWILADHVHVS